LTDSPRQRWLDRADSLGRWAETFVLVALFAGLLLLAAAQILLRNGFSAGLVWADELIRLLVLWLAVAGAVAASRDQKHIAIELIARSLSADWRRMAVVVVNLFACIVSGVLAWQSWRFVRDSMEFGDMLLGDWPAWILQVSLPIGFALISYRFLVHAAIGLTRRS